MLISHNKPEAAIISSFVGANNVFKPILSTSKVAAAIGEEHGRATHPKKTIRNEHGPIASHHLTTNHHRIIIRISLQHVTSQVQCNNPCTAAHSSKIEAQNISPHLVVIYDHGRKGRHRVKYAAIHHQHSHILWPYSGFLKKLV